MDKTIWLNLDENKVDVTYLDRRFEKSGYNFIKKEIPADDFEGALKMAKKADIVISINETWNEKMFEETRNKIKLVMKYGAGTDNIDINAATKAKIPVANVPGANSAAVAEVTLLHILNVGRRFSTCVDGGKKGIWPSTITGNELDGKVLGLIGVGHIGQQLIRLLKGFDIQILAYDPYLPKESVQDLGIKLVEDVDEIFKQSDIVSLHVPLTSETEGLINKEKFKLMKSTAYIINTCRGKVINQRDLTEALEEKKIAGAGLDVLEIEPPDLKDPLFKMDNVFITSHMGAASLESEHRSQIIIADTIDQFIAGEYPSNIKNKEVFNK